MINEEQTTKVLLQQWAIGKHNNKDFTFVATCLLCGEQKEWENCYPIDYHGEGNYSFICSDCKKIWGKLKRSLSNEHP